MRLNRLLPLAAILLLPLAACEDRADGPVPTTTDPALTADRPVDDMARYTTTRELFDAEVNVDAAAIIRPTRAGSAQGYVTFTEMNDGGLRVRVMLEGLEPNSQRGFHVHENGSCEDGADGTPAGAAGGHFSPLDGAHGSPDDPVGQRHIGDFGNLSVDADGRVDATFQDDLPRLTGERGIVGKAVIVHLDQDDLETQPTGDAGGRAGCGIVEAR